MAFGTICIKRYTKFHIKFYKDNGNEIRIQRLRCLLGCIERNDKGGLVEPADKMDLNQVMLWLDDIGLPQLRDIFAENRIDGQMLLCLTAQDLIEMRVFLVGFFSSNVP